MCIVYILHYSVCIVCMCIYIMSTRDTEILNSNLFTSGHLPLEKHHSTCFYNDARYSYINQCHGLTSPYYSIIPGAVCVITSPFYTDPSARE